MKREGRNGINSLHFLSMTHEYRLHTRALEEQPELLIGPESVRNATAVAEKLADIIERQKLYMLLDGKKYVTVEGWSTLGSMFGVFPEVVDVENQSGRKVSRILAEIEQFTRKNSHWEKRLKKKFIDPALFDPTRMRAIPTMDGLNERQVEEIKYRAIVELKHISGFLVTTAESVCSNLEDGRVANDEYVIASMAQTRAVGKAYRLAFSWVVKMAGYEATPLEEMPTDQEQLHLLDGLGQPKGKMEKEKEKVR
jgi:hypothetical protein